MTSHSAQAQEIVHGFHVTDCDCKDKQRCAAGQGNALQLTAKFEAILTAQARVTREADANIVKSAAEIETVRGHREIAALLVAVSKTILEATP